MGPWLTYVSSDDQAAQLVDDEHVQRGGGLAELLLQDLQDGLHDLRGVPQRHRDVAQGSDGVVGDQVCVPARGGDTGPGSAAPTQREVEPGAWTARLTGTAGGLSTPVPGRKAGLRSPNNVRGYTEGGLQRTRWDRPAPESRLDEKAAEERAHPSRRGLRAPLHSPVPRGGAYLSLSWEMYRRLERLARKASTITGSTVRPAFRHLSSVRQHKKQVSACVWSRFGFSVSSL